jgi:hypothetical protein
VFVVLRPQRRRAGSKHSKTNTMGETGIPDEVQAFVRDNIDSIEQLEVLLLLARAPDESWSAELVARELRIDAASAGRRLEQLAKLRLIERSSFEGRFHYSPGNVDLDRRVAGLRRAYAERRVALITLIFTKPDPVQAFADAFRVREPKK